MGYPGDFFSDNSTHNFRQSGGFEFKFAKLCDDTTLFTKAFGAAKHIAQIDPELDLPEHAGLKTDSVILLTETHRTFPDYTMKGNFYGKSTVSGQASSENL